MTDRQTDRLADNIINNKIARQAMYSIKRLATPDLSHLPNPEPRPTLSSNNEAAADPDHSVRGLTVSAGISLALTKQSVLRPRPAPRAELRDMTPGVVWDVARVESSRHCNQVVTKFVCRCPPLTVIPGVQVVHATSVEAPVGLLAVHGHRVPVLARPEAETGEAGKWCHGRTRGDTCHVEAVH